MRRLPHNVKEQPNGFCDLDMLAKNHIMNYFFSNLTHLTRTSLRENAYSAMGACVESGVKMITASPGERASIASLSTDHNERPQSHDLYSVKTNRLQDSFPLLPDSS